MAVPAHIDEVAAAIRPYLPVPAIDLGGASTRLARFVQLVLLENRRHNLTATRNAAEFCRTHIADSLALLALLRQHGTARLLDLGSGGGLPGIPLACVCSDLRVTLLDATQKKVAALQRIIAALELPNVRAVSGRAEALAHDPAYREQFDGVTARAVASLRVLVEYAAGFAHAGGYCWFYKSAAAAEKERAAAASAARHCHLRYVETRRYRLQGDSAERAILVYSKEDVLSTDLPRRPGEAKKHPL